MEGKCLNARYPILDELHYVEKKNGRKFDYVRLSLSDLNGISRTNVVPRRHLEKNLIDGFGCFGGLLNADTRANLVIPEGVKCYGNLKAVPCEKTLHSCSWCSLVGLKDEKTVPREAKWMVGEIFFELKRTLPNGEDSFMQECPRYALRRQLKRLQDMGFSLKSAFEIEFCLFHGDTMKPVFSGKDVGTSLLHSKFEDYLYTIEKSCYDSGVDLEALRVEHGEGQFELVMEPKFDIKTADNVTVLKEAVKEISSSMGYTASFMTLPSKDLSTSGFHLNLSLWKTDGTNAFYDAEDPEHLSSTFRHFLAGLIKHAKALTAFCCPTFNCYRRLNELLTPSKINWTIDDRNVTFRVKNGGASCTYLENRLPSSACNPYLATAATLAAGIDGIVNKLPLRDKSIVEVVKGLSGKKELKGVENDESLPNSLKEALCELEQDETLKRELGEELVRWFVELKRQSEVEVLEKLGDEDRWKKEQYLYFEFI